MIATSDIATPTQMIALVTEHVDHDSAGDVLAAVTNQWVSQQSEDQLRLNYLNSLHMLEGMGLLSIAHPDLIDEVQSPTIEALVEHFDDCLYDEDRRTLVQQASTVATVAFHEDGGSPHAVLDTIVPWLDDHHQSVVVAEAMTIYAEAYCGSDN